MKPQDRLYLFKHYYVNPETGKLLNVMSHTNKEVDIGETYSDVAPRPDTRSEFRGSILGLDNRVHSSDNSMRHGLSTWGMASPEFSLVPLRGSVTSGYNGITNVNLGDLPTSFQELAERKGIEAAVNQLIARGVEFLQPDEDFKFTQYPYADLLDNLNYYDKWAKNNTEGYQRKLALVSAPLDKIVRADEMVSGKLTPQRDDASEIVAKELTINDEINLPPVTKDYKDALSRYMAGRLHRLLPTRNSSQRAWNDFYDQVDDFLYEHPEEFRAYNLLKEGLAKDYLTDIVGSGRQISDAECKFVSKDLSNYLSKRQRTKNILTGVQDGCIL